MSESTPGVHRCPSCGELAKVAVGKDGKKACGSCGFAIRSPVRVAPRNTAGSLPPGRGKFVQRDVGTRRRYAEPERVIAPAPTVPKDVDVITPAAAPEPEDEVVTDESGRKMVRRRKKQQGSRIAPILFLCAWFGAAMMVVLFVRNRIKSDLAPTVNQAELDERRREQAKQAQVEDYLRRQTPECHEVLKRFFDSGDPAGRAQSVLDPMRVTPHMVAHYRHNPPRRPTGVLRPLVQNLYVDGGNRAIETVWRDPSGEDMEVVFVRQEGQWRIDWESFVRYGTAEWLLFVGGTPREGEFRVFMRVIETAQTAGEGKSTVGLKFYPPSYDQRLRTRGESDTVLVPVAGELAQRLRDVRAARERTPGIGDTVLGHRDPDDLYRVRVKLAWKEGGSGQSFLELKEIVAPNWYGAGFEEIGWKIGIDSDDSVEQAMEGPAGLDTEEDTPVPPAPPN